MIRGWLSALVCCAALGCTRPAPSQVMLIVDADPATASRTNGLRIQVWGWDANARTPAAAAPSVATTPEEPAAVGTLELEPGELVRPDGPPDFEEQWSPLSRLGKFPFRFALAPLDGDTGRRYEVLITLLADERVVAISRAQSGFLPGRGLLLPIDFTERCLSQSLRCSAEETCRDGACVSLLVDPTTLARFDHEQFAALGTQSAANAQAGAAAPPRRAPTAMGSGRGYGTSARCGDGTLDADELCDGDAFAEACPALTCMSVQASCDATCKPVCTYRAEPAPCCGNGAREGAEECDGEAGCVSCRVSSP